MHEVMSIDCGTMFGEERVNNSIDLLSRVLVAFSVGQISALVTVTYASLAFFSRRTNTSSVLHTLRACVFKIGQLQTTVIEYENRKIWKNHTTGDF